MKEAISFSRVIDPLGVSHDGQSIVIEANAAERQAMADALGLLGLASLRADLALTRSSSGLVTAQGRLHADLTQACVVTLEPVDQRIDQEIERRFAPKGAVRSAGRAVDVIPEAVDPPDEYGNDGIDLGAFLVEEFILAIDPYPRAPGAELPEEAAPEDGEGEPSPFAALKSLGHSDGR